MQAGDEALAVFAVEEALWHFEQARALFQKQVQGRMLETYEKKSLPPLPAEDITSRIPMDQTRFPQLEHLYVSLELIYTYRNAEEQALEVYEELLAFARQQQLPALVSMTLNRMVIRLIQRSFDRPQAFMLLKEAMHMAEISQDQRVLAETQWNQAQILSIVGEDLMQSLLHAKQALDLAQSISDKELEARSLSLQGFIHLWKGDFREAIRLIEP